MVPASVNGTSISHAHVAPRLTTFYPGVDVAIGAIERHTVTGSKLTKPLVCQNCPDAKQA